MFPEGDPTFIPRAFSWANDCFTGRYPGYQPIDALYHDFEHTLQVTLCMVRLLRARHRVEAARPRLTQRMFELGLLAILLHDTGYLKRRGDNKGTGAKYTLIHVDRSGKFAEKFLRERGFSMADIHAVQDMIHCTGVNVDLKTIPFESRPERIVGFALSTGDLLGQMAAEDYVDRLPELYREFEEATEHEKGGSKGSAPGMFAGAEDLMRKTPGFWQYYVLPKINKEFLGLYKYLSEPFPDGPNDYVQRIEANIAKVSRLNAQRDRNGNGHTAKAA
jgi:hypothetical protein